MTLTIQTEPLTADAFAPFGDVMDVSGAADMIINQDMCGRYHDRANLDFGPNGRAGISFFDAKPRALPYVLELVERHPDGSQAFISMSQNPFLVIVAPDEADKPGTPRAFLTGVGQAINIRRNIWHGVLAPLFAPGLFAVVDRIGESPNLEEYWFDTQYVVRS